MTLSRGVGHTGVRHTLYRRAIDGSVRLADVAPRSRFEMGRGGVSGTVLGAGPSGGVLVKLDRGISDDDDGGHAHTVQEWSGRVRVHVLQTPALTVTP